MQCIEREGLQDDLTVGVTNVHLAAGVETSVGGRLGDNVPAALGKHVIHANLHILGVQPALLELDVDAGTVAGVLVVVNIGVGKVILHKVHVLRSIAVAHAGIVTLDGLVLAFVNLLQRHAFVFVLDAVGEHALAIGVAAQLLALGKGNLVLDGRYILAVAIDDLAIIVVAVVAGGEAGTCLLQAGIVEPTAGVEHQQLGIVVGHGVERAEVMNVTLVLTLDVALAEDLVTVLVLETAVEVLAGSGYIVAEDVLDVGRTLQVLIMVGEHDTVLGGLHIALQVVGTHLTGPTPRCLGLLGRPEDGATVSSNGIQGDIVTHLCQIVGQDRNLNPAGISVLIGELLFFLT